MAEHSVTVGGSIDLNISLDGAGPDVGLRYELARGSLSLGTLNTSTGVFVSSKRGLALVTVYRTSDQVQVYKLMISILKPVEASLIAQPDARLENTTVQTGYGLTAYGSSPYGQ